MPNYKCNNKDCTEYGIEKQEGTTLKIVGNKVVDTALTCKQCGKEREYLPDEGLCSNFVGGPNIPKL